MNLNCTYEEWGMYACDKIWLEQCSNYTYGFVSCPQYVPIIITIFVTGVVLGLLFFIITKLKGERRMINKIKNDLWEYLYNEYSIKVFY